LVAAGTRVIKVSKADTEAGSIVAVNGPKGVNHLSSSWGDVSEKQDKLRKKIYVPEVQAGPVLGAVYRPQDVFDVSDFYNSNAAVYYNHDTGTTGERLYASPVYFSADGTAWNSQVSELANGTSYYIYFNTFLRHSYFWHIQTQYPLQLEFQLSRHFEFVPNREDNLMALMEEHLPLHFQDAIHLLRNTTEKQIFGGHEDILLDVLKAELQGMPVVGLWSETILPMAQDFMRWAKEIADKTGLSKFLADNAGDIALTALGTIQPELAMMLRAGLTQG